MFDSWKVILGLLIFLALFSFPLWYNASTGQADAMQDPIIAAELTAAGFHCVRDSVYMRSSHMDLLNEWRDSVVRHGDRTYVAEDGPNQGQAFVKSLQRTCIGCHYNKDTFCNRCHDPMAVSPNCWQCHIEPKESL